jgi:DNA-binding CsgD family transcriptional regulator
MAGKAGLANRPCAPRSGPDWDDRQGDLAGQLAAALVHAAELAQELDLKQARLATAPPAASPPPELELLTPREREVLALFLSRHSDKSIAGCLGTSPKTVGNQILSIEHKLGVFCRLDLFARFVSEPIPVDA